MLSEQNSISLIQKIESENLFKKLIEQLNKDFQLSNLDEHFDLSMAPNQLKQSLSEILVDLITNKYDDYLNFLYRVDVSEKELLTIKSNELPQLVEQITFLILKREYQKVWFKNKL
ncbi:MAG: hypothetical protein HKP59_03830 [Lutibacter sp.]|uniref:hypothetical protein n=1 Tax=Lutibacter sp. TaxID=1925666 RepID=UPI001804A3CB|nr:hypothetical protein [Lutibacter sp.]MBT8316730.1 hypothetical protein [Lutibacter sp.]NNJ57590.1 hypothetical protein [Lutibacter sp.]